MSIFSKAFHHITHAISHGLHDLGHLAKSVVTLDLKGIKNSAKDLVHDAGELTRGAFSLTPAGLAAGALLGANYDKLMDTVEKFGEGMVNGVIDDADKFACGVGNSVKDLAHGDFHHLGKDLMNATLGGASLALDFCPATAVESRVASGLAKEGVELASHGASEVGHLTRDLAREGVDAQYRALNPPKQPQLPQAPQLPPQMPLPSYPGGLPPSPYGGTPTQASLYGGGQLSLIGDDDEDERA